MCHALSCAPHSEIKIQQSLKGLAEAVSNARLAYVTHADIRNLPCFDRQTLFAIKAPSGATLTVPEPMIPADVRTCACHSSTQPATHWRMLRQALVMYACLQIGLSHACPTTSVPSISIPSSSLFPCFLFVHLYGLGHAFLVLRATSAIGTLPASPRLPPNRRCRHCLLTLFPLPLHNPRCRCVRHGRRRCRRSTASSYAAPADPSTRFSCATTPSALPVPLPRCDALHVAHQGWASQSGNLARVLPAGDTRISSPPPKSLVLLLARPPYLT